MTIVRAQNATDAAFDHIVEYQMTLQEQALDNIREAKPEMEINILSMEERQPFVEAAKQVEQAFIEMTGDSGEEILKQMKEDLAAAEN